MLKTIILFVFFIGILFIAIEVIKIQSRLSNKEPKIEYRYIPRSFEEEQSEPVYVSEIFETMFSQPTPWILSVREYDQKKQERINQFFVTQL